MSGSPRRRLSAQVALRVGYTDETRFGSMVSGRCDVELRRRLEVLSAYRRRYGLPQLVRNGAAILERVLPRCLEGICTAPDTLREDWLYPEPSAVTPALLAVIRNVADVTAQIPLDGALCGDLASYIGEWQDGASAPQGRAARALWDALVAEGALEIAEAAQPPTLPRGATFVGHATVRVSDGERQVLVDPFLLPKCAQYPSDWQPPSLTDLGPPDAVLVTHSHPDHYDLGALLRCGADTPIYVPAVRRESVLAIDMAARLRELGFRAVHALEPWSEFSVGSMKIVALPFYGEQPTVQAMMHPEVRNQGLTYVVDVGGNRIAALADAGADCSGNVKDMATEARTRYGPIDTIFGGYRGFAMYPVQYMFSSVTRYLPFVPAESRGERQRIMCDADDLIDVGERWRARRIVPYANGGAPWHWMRGLGPCLDGSSAADAPEETPEHVRAVAAHRSRTRSDGALPSPVEVRALRVGDLLPF